MQIKDGRQIQLFTEQAELRYIRDPFLIRLLRREIPIQQIWCGFSNFSLI